MILFKDKNECCGCTACFNICPVNAIKFEEDNEGFLYPIIIEDLCIECGQCEKVCPFKKYKRNNFQTKVFAVKHKDENVLYNSSSGGAFTAISDYILNNNGIVYGASFDETLKVIHTRAINAEQRDKMRGSKYVQSYLGDCFKLVEKDLKEGRLVLFSGTPCMCAGLRNYLDKEYPSLILCDIICHGVSSPKLFHDFVEGIFKNSSIKQFSFRSKRNGWRGYNVYIKKDNKESLNSLKSRTYALLYSKAVIIRPSCYNCKFTNFERPSDITIGDFWGIEKCKPHMDDNKGVSLVLTNSEKGQNIFENIKGDIYFEESNKEECLQHNLQRPTIASENRSRFFEDYSKRGFYYVAKKYTIYGFRNRCKHFTKRALVYLLKRLGLYDFVKRIREKSKN